jgi:hypothetical protein
MTEIKVFDASVSFISLPDLIEKLNQTLEMVPEKYREATTCNIEVEPEGRDDGYYYTRLHIYYMREETEEEFADRLKEIEALEKQEELRERRTLESLKKKYESN